MNTQHSIGNLSLTALLHEAAPAARTHENQRFTFSRGDTVNTFTVLDPLGAGASGEVYAVYDPQLRHSLALKLLPEASPEKQDLVLREARLLADLRHPNIVRVLRAELWKNRPYFVMELLKPLPANPTPDTVRDWLLALCSAVSELNSRGWIHRDIKAGNILYDDIHRQPVLADFGIASEENTHTVAGTPGSSAPEQFAGTADARSDIYALAMFAAKLLPEATLRTAPWKALLSEALSPIPALRPASAADFAERIRTAFAPPPPLWRRIRLHHILLALLLCFTGAVTVAYYIRPPVNTDDIRRAAEKDLLSTRPLILGEGCEKEHRVTKRVETVDYIQVKAKAWTPMTVRIHIPKGKTLYSSGAFSVSWANIRAREGLFRAHLILEGGGTLNVQSLNHLFTDQKEPGLTVELRDNSRLIERSGSNLNGDIGGWTYGTTPKPYPKATPEERAAIIREAERLLGKNTINSNHEKVADKPASGQPPQPPHQPTPAERAKARALILKLKGYTPAETKQAK